MGRVVFLASFLFWPLVGYAQMLLATHTLRARTIITADDIAVEQGGGPGFYGAPEEVLGLETRAVIYAGRPLREGDLGEPAIVERNQILPLIYRSGTLEIRTEGRALQRAGVGETIRVMNASSKSVVSATMASDGSAHVIQ